ncbi:MAG: hydroxypyruvate isomerase [Casimicrobiaceae bacterium]|nr:hydroxypyruvate isomerase [Casimicrobiaceae bacterium]MDW8312767.1 hydroxypyruvate isomerase [Burkholderiales bacterium]
MPRFSANLSFLFTERPFLERFAAARAAGFAGVEYHSPYEHDLRTLCEALETHGLTQVLFNLPMGDRARGDFGIACLPGREAEFRDGVREAIRYALALDCPQVNAIAGVLPEGLSRAEAEAILVANLRWAAAELQIAGIRLLIEPINDRDVPGFALTTSAQAVALIEAVGSTNLFLQYDCYHMQRMEGDLCATIERLLPRIAHIQFADVPGRGEPGTGEIRFEHVFVHLDRIGYRGWVGAEYRPSRGDTFASLGWLAL